MIHIFFLIVSASASDMAVEARVGVGECYSIQFSEYDLQTLAFNLERSLSLGILRKCAGGEEVIEKNTKDSPEAKAKAAEGLRFFGPLIQNLKAISEGLKKESQRVERADQSLRARIKSESEDLGLRLEGMTKDIQTDGRQSNAISGQVEKLSSSSLSTHDNWSLFDQCRDHALRSWAELNDGSLLPACFEILPKDYFPLGFRVDLLLPVDDLAIWISEFTEYRFPQNWSLPYFDARSEPFVKAMARKFWTLSRAMKAEGLDSEALQRIVSEYLVTTRAPTGFGGEAMFESFCRSMDKNFHLVANIEDLRRVIGCEK